MAIAIKIEHLSKAYQLGEIGTGTISRDLERWYAKMRGKEDPFLKVGEVNSRSVKSKNDTVWSLKDINLEIEQGDAVGIIGRNGAGKSTLLKILSRVTSPTTGSVKLKGRVASLLEVGTGFHPELTGKENIYLNGAILGMRKKEITRKFDEIVDFSGVERYIDTPVKRYSSGMYVRLAFAVAAHLDSEILIVDEVLAVGDAEFQKKCLGKMGEVSKGEGRTVLFVSHNMTAVKALCSRGILLNNGSVEMEDSVNSIVDKYQRMFSSDSNVKFDAGNKNAGNDFIQLNSIEIKTEDQSGNFYITEPFNIHITLTNKEIDTAVNVNLFFNAPDGTVIFATCSESRVIEKGKFYLTCKVPANLLNDNIYVIDVMVVTNAKPVLKVKEALVIECSEPQRAIGWLEEFPGYVRPIINWENK